MIKHSTALAGLHRHWQQLAPREQWLLRGAAALVLLAVLWWLALAPALHTLRTAPAQQARLDAQWQTMLALQTQAQALQKAPQISPEAALDALQTATTARLGKSSRLSIVGDRATVTLQGVPADALVAWLAQARSNARAVPQEMRLSHVANAAPADSRWDGTVVLLLPSR